MSKSRSSGTELFIATSAFLVALALLFWPYWTAGFYGDDRIHSLLKGQLELSGQSRLQMVGAWIEGWRSMGREFPISALVTAITSSPFLAVYHAWLLGLTLASSALASAAIARAAGLRFFPVWIASLCFFQFRAYHDPITSYAGMMQILVLLGFAAILWAQRAGGAAPRKRPPLRSLLPGAFLFYALALETYEPSLAFLPPLLLATRARRSVAWPLFLGITALWLARMGWLRAYATASYSGTTLAWDLGAIARAFFQQAMGALPATNGIFFLFPVQVPPGAADLRLSVLARAALLAITIFGLFQWASRDGARRPEGHQSSQGIPLLTSMALSFTLIPPALLALSPKYHAELQWGSAYLPVYLQYFGVLASVLAIGRFLPQTHPRLIGAMLGLLAAFHFVSNINARNLQNLAQKLPRDVAESAIRQGLSELLAAPPAIVVLEDCDLGYWFNEAFFMTYSSRRVTPVCAPDPRAQTPGAWLLSLSHDRDFLEVRRGAETRRFSR